MKSNESVIDTLMECSNDIHTIKHSGNGTIYQYKGNCSNNNLISEASLGRALDIMKNKDFAIITAYVGGKDGLSQQENVQRNKKLFDLLVANKLGPHKLVGHWLEGKHVESYLDANKEDLIDSVESSFLVSRPNMLMSSKEFFMLIGELMTINGITQNAVVIHTQPNDDENDFASVNELDDGYFLMFKNDKTGKLTFSPIGKNLSVGKIGEAYSVHQDKQHPDRNITFMFESNKNKFEFLGLEVPTSNCGKMMFRLGNMMFV